MNGRALRTIAISAVLGIAWAVLSCGDPVHDNEVSALGGEAPGVSPGPQHRPGQPCVVCHGGSGPASSQFAFGGTVYQIPYAPGVASSPLGSGTVKLTDATGAKHEVQTNAAGNFFLLESQWAPVFPVQVEVDFATIQIAMTTHIGREGSCASCHYDPPGRTTPGHVYVAATAAALGGGGP